VRALAAVALTAALGAFGVAAHGAPKSNAPPVSSSASAKRSSVPLRELRAELGPDVEGVHPEYAACPSTIVLTDLDPEGLVTAVRQRCLNLRVPPNAAPTEITSDDALVAICVRERRAIEARQCGMKLQAVVVGDDGPTSIPLTPEGDLVLALRAEKLDAQRGLESGTPFSLTITTQTATPSGLDVRNARSPLVFHRPMQPYGRGRWLWLPMPMLTTDFSSSPEGYRLGITPIAIGVGTRFYPWASRTYVGTSLFGAWNLLVPNDTQTLTNGTTVRVNYKALGAGVLFDLSGWIGVGVGVGHTFTTDHRTDFRTWFYVGPRILKLFGDL
jgi:hypothetical protein